ncbi:hypothetical protein R1sor_009061 [Riccia sorocarpa]|uniref:Uncharacterized protein n=1 Tax=Riccia sorocarpa TaxID=122646 RepID=A0ABD3H7J3_9MARC
MESCHGFHVSLVDEFGNDVMLEKNEEDGWDFYWKTASQDFDRECRMDPDFASLVGKKFKVLDGNHRLTVCMQVNEEAKFRNSKIHHPRVRCVVVLPPPEALKEMEVAMHNLNITSHATVQYDWIQDAERTLQVLSTPLQEYLPLLGEKVYAELEESRKKSSTRGWYSENMTITAGAYIMSYSEVMAAQKELSLTAKEMEGKGTPWTEKQKKDKWKRMFTEATRHWNSLIQKYATIVNPQLGPEFMITVRELQTTLSQQEKGGRDVKVEVGIDRIKAFAVAPVPPDMRVALLKVHYSSDAVARARLHHPPGNDVDTEIRPWLHQCLIESYCLQMLTECVFMQPAEAIAEIQAEEEEKFILHMDEYRTKFWKEVWNSGLHVDASEEEQNVYSSDTWCGCGGSKYTPPALHAGERLHLNYSRCILTMIHLLCYDRLLEAAQAQNAVDVAGTELDSLPELHEAYNMALDKLPQVFDPRKLQDLSPDAIRQQSVQCEPNAEKVQLLFGKLKRKKQVEKPAVKTPL